MRETSSRTEASDKLSNEMLLLLIFKFQLGYLVFFSTHYYTNSSRLIVNHIGCNVVYCSYLSVRSLQFGRHKVHCTSCIFGGLGNKGPFTAVYNKINIIGTVP